MTVRGIIALICVFVVVPFLIWQFAMDNRGSNKQIIGENGGGVKCDSVIISPGVR